MARRTACVRANGLLDGAGLVRVAARAARPPALSGGGATLVRCVALNAARVPSRVRAVRLSGVAGLAATEAILTVGLVAVRASSGVRRSGGPRAGRARERTVAVRALTEGLRAHLVRLVAAAAVRVSRHARVDVRVARGAVGDSSEGSGVRFVAGGARTSVRRVGGDCLRVTRGAPVQRSATGDEAVWLVARAAAMGRREPRARGDERHGRVGVAGPARARRRSQRSAVRGVARGAAPVRRGGGQRLRMYCGVAGRAGLGGVGPTSVPVVTRQAIAMATRHARRRHVDLGERNVETSLEEVREQQQQRDLQDTSRAESPLQVARGSVVVDTTGLTLDEVVERLFEEVARIH